MADAITFTWDPPLRERAEKWQQLAQKGDYKSMQQGADEISQRLTSYFRQLTPRRTGALAESIQVTQFRANGTIRMSFRGQSPKVGWLLRGTPAHVITGSPRLAFFWEKVGQNVVFASVSHPGQQPNNFARAVADAATSDMRASLRVIGANLIQELRGTR